MKAEREASAFGGSEIRTLVLGSLVNRSHRAQKGKNLERAGTAATAMCTIARGVPDPSLLAGLSNSPVAVVNTRSVQ